MSTTGDLFGDLVGTDDALGDGVLASILLDTSQLGDQAGVIEVFSSSIGIPNNLISIPVSFQVVSAVPEPHSLVFLALGSGLMLARRRR